MPEIINPTNVLIIWTNCLLDGSRVLLLWTDLVVREHMMSLEDRFVDAEIHSMGRNPRS